MIVYVRPTDPARAADPVRSFVCCMVCGGQGPVVLVPPPPRRAGTTVGGEVDPAVAAAVAAGWVRHDEVLRTPTGQRRRGGLCCTVQYFCPGCVGLAGTVKAFDTPRRGRRGVG